jgi:hypothetical protein
MQYEELFDTYKTPSLSGRYITLNHIEPLILQFENENVIGHSVLGKPIYSCQFGSGKTKILMWSQMHGNESTTTKALFDFLNFLKSNTAEARQLLDAFTFYAIPMLNPDGAQLYTRENVNSIDLNRDFCDLTQPESKILLEFFKEIKPHYCFNLHDQRTIYGAGSSGKPATVSFLAPSYNEERHINESRGKAINVIVAMNETLQQFIPGQVGRFDDSFNINCVGDTFQLHNVPTILFEAGHFPGDYQREMTRKYIFIALQSALKFISENVIVNNRITDYLHIPQNNINFYDFVYKNVKINYDGNEIITNFAAQFTEALEGDEVTFTACIAETGIAEIIHGHTEYDAERGLYKDENAGKPEVDQNADFYLGNTRFANGIKCNP